MFTSSSYLWIMLFPLKHVTVGCIPVLAACLRLGHIDLASAVRSRVPPEFANTRGTGGCRILRELVVWKAESSSTSGICRSPVPQGMFLCDTKYSWTRQLIPWSPQARVSYRCRSFFSLVGSSPSVTFHGCAATVCTLARTFAILSIGDGRNGWHISAIYRKEEMMVGRKEGRKEE